MSLSFINWRLEITITNSCDIFIDLCISCNKFIDFDEFINVLKETSLTGNDNFLSQNKKRTKSNCYEKVKFPTLTTS